MVIEEGVELGRGCIVGPGVRLTRGTKVPPNSRLVAHPPEKDADGFESSDEEGLSVISSPNIFAYSESALEVEVAPVSPGSTAYFYVKKREDDSDVESLVSDLWDLNLDEESEDDDHEEFQSSDDDEEGFTAGDYLDENNVKRINPFKQSLILFANEASL